MPLGKTLVFLLAVFHPLPSILLEAASSVLSHRGVFSVLEGTLSIVFFSQGVGHSEIYSSNKT